ncbi:MAG: nuclear transport factor 2 family protein [Pseudolabrys sp.]
MRHQNTIDPVSRATVEAFYEAFKTRDPQRIGAMLDDDVEWTVSGPVEVMQFCGTWRGKNAVIERFASHVPKLISFLSLDIEHLLVDGDCSSMFGRFTVRQCDSGRLISYRLAHIVRYRNGKVIALRCLNDSLDAAEQYIGHRINLTGKTPPAFGDVIAI